MKDTRELPRKTLSGGGAWWCVPKRSKNRAMGTQKLTHTCRASIPHRTDTGFNVVSLIYFIQYMHV
jgi:hypothetical protein